MEFECTACGLCCKKIGLIMQRPAPYEWMQPAKDAFPYKANPDGSCEKLIDNRCSVYDDRPLMCDIGRMGDEMNLPMSKEKWFDMNYEGCKRLQMEIL